MRTPKARCWPSLPLAHRLVAKVRLSTSPIVAIRQRYHRPQRPKLHLAAHRLYHLPRSTTRRLPQPKRLQNTGTFQDLYIVSSTITEAKRDLRKHVREINMQALPQKRQHRSLRSQKDQPSLTGTTVSRVFTTAKEHLPTYIANGRVLAASESGKNPGTSRSRKGLSMLIKTASPDLQQPRQPDFEYPQGEPNGKGGQVEPGMLFREEERQAFHSLREGQCRVNQ